MEQRTIRSLYNSHRISVKHYIKTISELYYMNRITHALSTHCFLHTTFQICSLSLVRSVAIRSRSAYKRSSVTTSWPTWAGNIACNTRNLKRKSYISLYIIKCLQKTDSFLFSQTLIRTYEKGTIEPVFSGNSSVKYSKYKSSRSRLPNSSHDCIAWSYRPENINTYIHVR